MSLTAAKFYEYIRKAEAHTTPFEKLTKAVGKLMEKLIDKEILDDDRKPNKAPGFTAEQLRNKKNGLISSWNNVGEIVKNTTTHEGRITALLTANTVLEQLAQELEYQQRASYSEDE